MWEHCAAPTLVFSAAEIRSRAKPSGYFIQIYQGIGGGGEIANYSSVWERQVVNQLGPFTNLSPAYPLT